MIFSIADLPFSSTVTIRVKANVLRNVSRADEAAEALLYDWLKSATNEFLRCSQ